MQFIDVLVIMWATYLTLGLPIVFIGSGRIW